MLEQGVADVARRIAVLRDQRLQQIRPVRRDPRRALRADMDEVVRLVRIIRPRQHRAVGGQQRDLGAAVSAVAVGVPGLWIGPTKPELQLLGLVERQLAAGHLDRQDGQVDVVEEVQFDPRNIERKWDGATAQSDARAGNIAPPEDANCRRFMALRSLAIEEALDVGHEGHEFAVVAFLKVAWIVGEFVGYFAPRAVCPEQAFPVRTSPRRAVDRG